jgi:delta(3,5)-delta(2,4)-dienoyl-CoA isomerase
VLSSSIPKLFSAGIDCKSCSFARSHQESPKHSEVAAANDIGEMATKDPEVDRARAFLAMRKYLLEFQHAIGAPGRCPFPVIAALHGAVVGLGVDLISACDIRYAASDASFAIKARTLSRVPKYSVFSHCL